MSFELQVDENNINGENTYELDNSFDEINKQCNDKDSFNCFAHQSLVNLGEILKNNVSKQLIKSENKNPDEGIEDNYPERKNIKKALRYRKIRSFNFVNSRTKINSCLQRSSFKYEAFGLKENQGTPISGSIKRCDTERTSENCTKILFSTEKTDYINFAENKVNEYSEKKHTIDNLDGSSFAMRKNKGFNFKNSKQKISTIITKGSDSLSQDSRLDEGSPLKGNLSQILAEMNLSQTREKSFTNDLSNIIEEQGADCSLKKSISVNDSLQASQFNKKKLKGFNFRNLNISGKQKSDEM